MTLQDTGSFLSLFFIKISSQNDFADFVLKVAWGGCC